VISALRLVEKKGDGKTMEKVLSNEILQKEKKQLEAEIARLEELNRNLVQAHEDALALAAKYRLELEKLRRKTARPEVFYYGGKVSNG
jgi:hypothetical protein